MVISTIRIAPVAIVLPSSASATSLVRLSAMMPEPTTVATNSAVPSASATKRRGSSNFGTYLLLPCRRAAWRQTLDQRRADVRLSATAIPQHEQHHTLYTCEISAGDDGATMTLGRDKAGAREDRQMR